MSVIGPLSQRKWPPANPARFTAAPSQAALELSAVIKLRPGTAKLSYVSNGVEKSSQVTFGGAANAEGEEVDFSVFHIDPTASSNVQGYFCGFFAVEDLINGVGARRLGGQDLSELCYLAKRNYRAVSVFETDYADDVAPFFEVMLDDGAYDSRSMGAGELSTLYLWWLIERAPENSLLLIEEPETFLSPAAQESFAHFLTMMAVDKKLNVVMTSHSNKIISNFPDEASVFISREGQGVTIRKAPVPQSLLEQLGFDTRRDIFIFVEDNRAKQFLTQIVRQHRPALSRRIEIGVKDGSGNVISAVQQIADVFHGCRLLGLLDGDARGEIPKKLEHRLSYLPGNEPIEVEFRHLVEADVATVTAQLGAADLPAILAGLGGLDAHDWFARLAEQLGMTDDQLFLALFRRWHQEPDNENACREAADRLVKLAGLEE